MAKRKDAAAAAAKNETSPAVETPAVETTAERSAPPPAEPPKIEAIAEAPKIQAPKVELPVVESPSVDPLQAETSAMMADDIPPVETPTRPDFATLIAKPAIRSRARTRRYALLAASVALAAAIGAIVGAGVTVAFSHQTPAVDTTSVTQTRALKDNIARLSGELWTVKSGVEAANKSSAAQYSKLADRLDRAEKAQAEPAAKLAKIIESLDRLEHRPQIAAAAASDTTGSITAVEKEQSKPPVIEGWRLVDFYAGRAVLENRAGAMFEVAPGANLPGVGKVESVKREDRRVVVTTAKGIIAANFEQRRAPYYVPPYRY